MPRPLIDRSFIYNFLPQEPAWFSNRGHHKARARFREKLRTQYAMESINACPLCQGTAFTSIATKERHGLPISVMLCNECGLSFNSPRPNEEALHDHYARDYREIERGILPNIHEYMFSLQLEKGPLIWAQINPHLQSHNQELRVAEIGCGEGGALAWIKNNVSKVSLTGYELNLSAVTYGRERGLDIRREYIAPQDRFDVIILEQVLEHLSDIRAVLSAVSAAQQPGALLYVGVPGIFNVTDHYESNFISYLEYGHLFHFSLHTLERTVSSHGYRLIEGDESVCAVFVRVDTPPAALKSPVVDGAKIKDHILELERVFRVTNCHFRTRWRFYLKYLLTYTGLLKR